MNKIDVAPSPLDNMSSEQRLLILYFKIGFSTKEMLAILAHRHSVVIGIRTLKRLCRTLRLLRSKGQTKLGEVGAFNAERDAGRGADARMSLLYS